MKTALIIAMLLAGCATEPRTAWFRAGATAQDFEIDRGQCNAQAFSVPGALNNMLQVAIVQNSCLRGRGWERRQVD